jgi:hypothetical protein
VILIQRESPPEPYKSFSLCIPMSLTHLSHVAKGKDFINKSVKVSHDLIHKIIFSSFSCNSCG